MTNFNDDDLRRLLADRNPVPTDADSLLAAVHHPQAIALRDRIVAATQENPPNKGNSVPNSRRRVKRRVAIAAAAVAVAVTVAVTGLPSGFTGHSSGTAYAATPPMLHYQYTPASGPAATDVLRQLASRAAQRQAEGTGDVSFLEYQAWGLSTAVSHGQGHSNITPMLVAQWTTPTGDIYQANATTATEAVDPTTSVREPSPAPTALNDARARQIGKTQLFDLGRLSTDPTTLARQLVDDPFPSGQPASIVSPDLARLDNLLYLYRQQALPPSLQSAIWQALATVPGGVDLGTVTDRLGRVGVAIAFDGQHGRPLRYVLIADPNTGMLLGDEEIATTKVGTGSIDPLGVRIPAVLDYHAYVAAGHVPSIHTHL
jgi:hypothetical protein